MNFFKIIFLFLCIYHQSGYSAGCGNNCNTPLEAAEKLFNEEKYEESESLYKSLARSGNAQAQYRLYELHRYSYGIKGNPGTAFEWLHKAAVNNHSAAQFELSVLYKNEGIVDKADLWLKKSVENEYPLALNDLGVKLYKEKNYKVACIFFEKAAQKGVSSAQYNFAIQIIHDRCEVGNRKKAFHWLLEASKQGNSQAQYDLAIMYEEGDGVEKNVDEAIYWLQKSIEKSEMGFESESGKLLSYFIMKYNKGAAVRGTGCGSSTLISNVSAPGTEGSMINIVDCDKVTISNSTQRGGTGSLATVRESSEVNMYDNKVVEGDK